MSGKYANDDSINFLADSSFKFLYRLNDFNVNQIPSDKIKIRAYKERFKSVI